MPRCSNAIICFANFLTVLVAASLIYGGLWIKAEANKECQHGLQWIIIISGVALLILSICGILGSCCRLNFFLWIYLFFMFLLIVFTVVAVAFSFAVTNKEVERTVSDFKVGNASTWLHKFATANWGTTVECMKESELCGHRMMMLLNKNNDSAEGQILRRTDLHGIISPIQAGCCMPPGDCGYTHVNETYWEVPETGTKSPDGDCKVWSNAEMCYGCDSCKAAMVESARRNVRIEAWSNTALLIVLVIIYAIGCCAFKNNRADKHDRYG